MTKVPRASLLVAIGMLSGLLASSASAASWHTNGPKAFASTNAGISRLVIHPHAGGSTVAFQCPASSLSGTLNGPTSAALPWASAATVTPVFAAAGNCTVSAAAGYTVACSSAELRANSYSGGDDLATAGGGITTVALTRIDCRLSGGASTCLTITGTVPAHYVNPSPLASGTGTLTVTAAGQSLTASHIGVGCAFLPAGSFTIGSPNGTGVGDTTYIVDGPNAPYIYRGT
jgi:hypothetical protein